MQLLYFSRASLMQAGTNCPVVILFRFFFFFFLMLTVNQSLYEMNNLFWLIRYKRILQLYKAFHRPIETPLVVTQRFTLTLSDPVAKTFLQCGPLNYFLFT